MTVSVREPVVARIESPRVLLLKAVGWFVAGTSALAIVVLFVAVITALIIGILVAHISATRHIAMPDLTGWLGTTFWQNVLGNGLFEAALLYGAWRRARIVGGGNWRAGVGLMPVRHKRLLLGLLIAVIPVVLGWFYLLDVVLDIPGSDAILTLPPPDRWYDLLLPGIATIAVIGLFPAVAEEAFFRGWLWTGLRRHWGPLSVGLVTGGLFLLAHAPAGWTRPLYLLPSTVILTVARHRCDSLRASMALHMVNNLAASAGMLFVAALKLWLPAG